MLFSGATMISRELFPESEMKKEYRKICKMSCHSHSRPEGNTLYLSGREIGMTNAGYTSIDEYMDIESLNYYNILKLQGKSEEEVIRILGAKSRDNSRTQCSGMLLRTQASLRVPVRESV